MSQAHVDNKVLEEFRSIVHSIVRKNLLDLPEADTAIAAITERVFMLVNNMQHDPILADYFAYLNPSEADVADLISPVTRIVCLEALRRDRNLYLKFVRALFNQEIAKKRWSHFFFQQGCTEQQSLDLFQNSFMLLDTIIQTESPDNALLGDKPSYKGLATLTSFLYAVGKNKWRDERKRQTRHATSLPEDFDASDEAQHDILSALMKKEQYDHELRLLDRIGKKCREVLLHLVDGISLRESLTILNTDGYRFENENQLKQQRHRCRKSLSEVLSMETR